MGVKGDKEAVRTAYELSQKLYNEYPDNALAEAYTGSTLALVGRDAIDPGERIKLAMHGVKILDKAVHKDPHNIDIRVLRGYVCFRLPELYFHQTRTAVDDFKYLISRYEESRGIFTQDLYLQILYDLGLAYQNIYLQKDCDDVWKKLLSLVPDSKYKKLIHKPETARETPAASYYSAIYPDQKKN
jgi:hypothetical protein